MRSDDLVTHKLDFSLLQPPLVRKNGSVRNVPAFRGVRKTGNIINF